MKSKILNLLLIVTSLAGYLEWGGNNHTFLYSAEVTVLCSLFTKPAAVLHPFTIIPLTAQLILLITLFQRRPNKILSYIGIAGLGLLLWFIFIIGLISFHAKTVFSIFPFLVVSIITIQHYRKINKHSYEPGHSNLQ